MPSDETITLDPVEFVPERTELGLDLLGIRVRESEWGDSEHEMFMVRQALGEIPADRHPPNRTVNITLRVEETKTNNLAEAVHRLQQKVGLLQREGGWVRRDFDADSEFSEPVATRVHAAVLGGVHGWMMAHRQRAPEVVLTLTTDPYFYGIEEVELAEVKAENARRLEYEIKEGKGSAPGLIRVLVKNEGTAKWFSILHSLESRDYSNAATAKAFYEAEALTLTGKAAKGARTGASGEVVKSGSLSNSWQSMLYSKIKATELHMTHIGTRRLLMRVYDPNMTAPGAVKMRLEWRALGSNQWTQNPIVTAPLVGGFAIVDLGEVIPDMATLGSQRWEFRLMVKTTGTVGQEIEIDCAYVLSTEQYLRAKEAANQQSGGTIVWEDNFLQAGGSATGKIADVGGAYTGAGDVDDFKVMASGDYLQRHEGSGANGDSSITNGRYLISGAGEFEEVTYELELEFDYVYGSSGGRSCQLLRYKDTSNWLMVGIERAAVQSEWYFVILKCVAGVVTTIKKSAVQKNLAGIRRLVRTTVKTDGSVTATIFTGGVPLELSATDEVLGTGKTLGKGKLGIYDVDITSTTAPRQYYHPVATLPPVGAEAVPDAITFPNRSIEIRSDGLFRQHETDDVWGRVVPDGFLPFLPPAMLENRVAKGIIIPSAGDFGSVEDAGTHKLSARVMYFPGYHFASEAK